MLSSFEFAFEMSKSSKKSAHFRALVRLRWSHSAGGEGSVGEGGESMGGQGGERGVGGD